MTRKNSSSNSELFKVLLVLVAVLFMSWVVHHQKVALLLFQNPDLILPYVIEEIGLFWIVAGAVLVLAALWFLVASSAPTSNVLRGASIVSSRKLKAILKRMPKLRNQPQLSVAGMPIPYEYENRGFLTLGDSGSGKTLAINEFYAISKKRTDYRGIVLDRIGESLEKFFDPTKDIIFNPHDARSCYWSHIHEQARPETIAAGLIPTESTREPFFSNAARAVMAELFRKTRNNAELLELLQGNLVQLKTFLTGTMAYRYLEEAKVATSVLSTAANYCQFYESLVTPQANALSFYQWGASDDPRWIFITLNEDDTELFKPLYTLAFELMLKGLLSSQERTLKTAIIIDELGALNKLPSLSRLLSESRKFLGCPILGTQTEAQITKVYGQEDTRILLQGTKTKVILRCSDPQTAETMARVIGRQERVELTNNRNRSRSSSSKGTGSGSSYGENEQLREAYAVMPSEIQNLPDLKGYLKISDLPAAKIQVKIRDFFRKAERFIPRSQASVQTDTNAESIQEQWKQFPPSND